MKKSILGKVPAARFTAAVAVVLMSTCVSAVTQHAAFAQDPAAATNADKKISLNFQNAPVQTVLKTLFNSVGANNSIDPDVQGPVNVTMNNVTFDVALRSLLRAANPPLTYDLTDNVYHVRVKRRDTPATTYTNGGRQTATTTTTSSTTSDADKRLYKLPVDHMDVAFLIYFIGDQKGISVVPAYGSETQNSSNGSSGGGGGFGGGQGGGGFGGGSSGGFGGSSGGFGGSSGGGFGGGSSGGFGGGGFR
ncbi:hypothetical protein CCAX7_33040 [Capsulimonas corticalis]|uniref:Uncharacterized protein n=1 Tax=Capsulimonas corticalis TaxID=2219043 RepID=A0A402CYQ3_9BACT|nr:hypothetical protein [Capsulimonas corticalis]BDI31253.1 hypothetical protein CCAX7_33040 [Capsulimonas corticalis]